MDRKTEIETLTEARNRLTEAERCLRDLYAVGSPLVSHIANGLHKQAVQLEADCSLLLGALNALEDK